MIVARFLQGTAGAIMNPIARLIVLRSAPRHRMVSANSWLILPATLGPILGPPLGGFLVTYVGWRWIFYINLPIGLVALVLVSWLFEEHRAPHRSRIDLTGFLLTGVSLSCLLFGLQFATHSGYGVVTAALLLVSGVLAGLYVRHALRHDHPILDVRLLDLPLFRQSLAGGSLARITQGAQPYLLPLMFQLGFGMTAAAAGTIVLATAVGAFTTKLLVASVLKRLGFRTILLLSGVFASIGYATAGWFRPGWPWWVMVTILFASGLAMSFQFSSYNVLAYEEIPPERMSAATGFHTTFQQLMLSVGVSIGAVVLHLSMVSAGGRGEPALGDFTVSFMAVSLISVCGVWVNWRIPRDAGAHIGGRSVGRAVEPARLGR
jgi:MFS family permease